MYWLVDTTSQSISEYYSVIPWKRTSTFLTHSLQLTIHQLTWCNLYSCSRLCLQSVNHFTLSANNCIVVRSEQCSKSNMPTLQAAHITLSLHTTLSLYSFAIWLDTALKPYSSPYSVTILSSMLSINFIVVYVDVPHNPDNSWMGTVPVNFSYWQCHSGLLSINRPAEIYHRL